MTNSGQLFIVATPIGNPGDITLRALEVLRRCSAIICEEQREGEALLKKYEIPAREIITLNEHNEAERVPDLVRRILLTGDSMALISDCGTPVFSDPGAALIQHATEMGVPVIPVPGASSLM